MSADVRFQADTVADDCRVALGERWPSGDVHDAFAVILDLHAPDDGYASCEDVGCDGMCDAGEHTMTICAECRFAWYDSDIASHREWPCPTVRAVASALGVAVSR